MWLASAQSGRIERLVSISVIYLLTVNYNSAELIQSLLASILPEVTIATQVLIVNNSPEDKSILTLASACVQILEAGENLGFGGGCNLGLQWVYQRDRGAIVWLINPDTTLPPGSLQTACQVCQTHPQLSIMGTVVKHPDGAVWFGGGEFNPAIGRIVATSALPLSERDYIETAWVTGCSLLIQFSNFLHCPQFDPEYFLYYEDFDFCRRYAAQGHTIALMPQIQVIHQPSSITGRYPALKQHHATYSYLLALEKHTSLPVVVYRLSRILVYAVRSSFREPQTAIAIIKGVLRYLVRVSRFAPFSSG